MLRRLYSEMRDALRSRRQAALPAPAPSRPRIDVFARLEPLFTQGTGLEIGGPSHIFGDDDPIPVYSVARRIDNCVFAGDTAWLDKAAAGSPYQFHERQSPGRQFIAEACDLKFAADASYDYLLSSHCIEHLANPLQGLAEWRRVLKPEGVLLLALPHKDGTFDHRRPVTTLAHLIEDHAAGTTEADLTHLDEVLSLHDLAQDRQGGTPESFAARCRLNLRHRCLHHHVFDTRLAVEAVHHARLQILALHLFFPHHILVIARKPGDAATVDNEAYRGIKGPPCWYSPFRSDGMAA